MLQRQRNYIKVWGRQSVQWTDRGCGLKCVTKEDVYLIVGRQCVGQTLLWDRERIWTENVAEGSVLERQMMQTEVWGQTKDVD